MKTIRLSEEELNRLSLLIDKEIKAKTNELKAIDRQTFSSESKKSKHINLQSVHIALLSVIKTKLISVNEAYGGLGREADEPGFYDRDIF